MPPAVVMRTGPASYWWLSIRDSLISADQPVLEVQGLSMSESGNRISQAEFVRSSFFLGDSLAVVTARGENPEIPRPIEILSNHSLYVGNGMYPFTRSSGNHSIDSQQTAIAWRGGSGSSAANFIAGFTSLFRYGGKRSATMPVQTTSLDGQAWLDHFGLREGFYIGQADIDGVRSVDPWNQVLPGHSTLEPLGLPKDLVETPGANTFSLPTPRPENS